MNEQERQELESELRSLRAYAAELPVGSADRLEYEQTIREGEALLSDAHNYAAKPADDQPTPSDSDDDDDDDGDDGEGDVTDEELRQMLEELGIDPAILDKDDDPDADGDGPDDSDGDGDGDDSDPEGDRKYADALLTSQGGDRYSSYSAGYQPEPVAAPMMETFDYPLSDADVAPAPAYVPPVAEPARDYAAEEYAANEARVYAERQREAGNRYERETIAKKVNALVEANRVTPAERNKLIALAYTLADVGSDEASGLRAYSDNADSRRDAVDDLLALFSEREELGLTRQYTQEAAAPAVQEAVRITVPGHAQVDSSSADLASRIHNFMRQEGITNFAEGMLKYEQKHAGEVKAYAARS